MKKFVALLTKEKGKTAMNEWENDNFKYKNNGLLRILCAQHISIKL